MNRDTWCHGIIEMILLLLLCVIVTCVYENIWSSNHNLFFHPAYPPHCLSVFIYMLTRFIYIHVRYIYIHACPVCRPSGVNLDPCMTITVDSVQVSRSVTPFSTSAVDTSTRTSSTPTSWTRTCRRARSHACTSHSRATRRRRSTCNIY